MTTEETRREYDAVIETVKLNVKYWHPKCKTCRHWKIKSAVGRWCGITANPLTVETLPTDYCNHHSELPR